MIYLIDGHNLIAKMPDIDLDDPNDEVKLVLRLRSWASAQRSRRVVVVFDQGLPGGKQKQLSNADITAVFASAGKTADSLIINRIHNVKNPREYTVISSDQMILDAANQHRIATMRSEAFVQEMGVDKRLPTAASEPEAGAEAEPEISDKDVAQWLELFGPEPETPKRKRPAPPPVVRQASPPPAAPPAKEKKPPLPLSKQKRSTRKLDADQVDEWLQLFGAEPEPPPPTPTASSSATPPAKPKRSSSKLDPEDVEEWLRLFGDGNPKPKRNDK